MRNKFLKYLSPEYQKDILHLLVALLVVSILGGTNHTASQQIIFATSVLVFFSIFHLEKKDKKLSKENSQDKSNRIKEKDAEIEELRKEIEALQQANTCKDELLKIMAHDLKSPVDHILGLVEIIRLEPDMEAEEREDTARKIVEAGGNIKLLIDNLLRWSLSNQGRLSPKVKKVDIPHLMDSVFSLYGHLAEKKNIQLINNIPSQVYIMADEDHMFTIMRNIVNNALKYTDEGGIVEVSSDKGKSHAHLKIKDNGVGISNEKLESLFDNTIKNSRLGTDGESGNGIGLAICDQLVKLNKGRIQVSSVLGEGSEFIVSIPIRGGVSAM
ncbi:HAMP domain-containing sensor histidine kinase [Fulvivirgaceae bacterium BMA10]|uniref:histidine kinase n=1 Tax=Splendidivirga corallicola TaxID=3051826 RepID=A0ABT8L214_9BACT|nr:HAMP domain-containing sensor histidine kinase [Fulvivirgaceae bacterium BMA10]